MANMLNDWEARTIRADLPKQSRLIEYGDLEVVVSTGRATCKACGQKIAKGERCLRFMWDFNGSGSWTAQQVHMHEKACSNPHV